MSPKIAHLRWKGRQARHHIYTFVTRYRLATGGFATGLGSSAWLLHGLVRSLRPAVCVEIGSAQGWSTCHIALALKENLGGRLYAVDPHQATQWNDAGPIETLPILQKNLRRCRLEQWVQIVRATSAEAAEGWPRPIDLLFIDGDHSYDGVRRDWELFSPYLSRFGVAVFHDTAWELHGLPRPDIGVPRFIEELRRGGFPVITIDRDCGLTLVQNHPGGLAVVPRCAARL